MDFSVVRFGSLSALRSLLLLLLVVLALLSFFLVAGSRTELVIRRHRLGRSREREGEIPCVLRRYCRYVPFFFGDDLSQTATANDARALGV